MLVTSNQGDVALRTIIFVFGSFVGILGMASAIADDDKPDSLGLSVDDLESGDPDEDVELDDSPYDIEPDEPEHDGPTIAIGHKLMVAAELGTTDDVLGVGFTKELSPLDAEGRPNRIYPLKFKEVPVKQYDLHLETIENTVQLDMHARYLFVRAGIKSQTNNRYAVLRISYIDKVTLLQPEGESGRQGDLLATKVYYGWALYLIVEGEKSAFTTDIAARLRTVGAGLETVAKNNRFSVHLHAIGIQPKNPGELAIATSPAEIVKKFKTPDVPVPIFVEYAARRKLPTKALDWARPELKPGRYRINVSVAVMSSKEDGRFWDGGGGPPDPVVSLYVDGQFARSCKAQDSFHNQCLSGSAVSLTDDSQIWLKVIDKDLSGDDDIGGTTPVEPVGKALLRRPFSLPTIGQVKSAEIIFTPLN